jgi:hypothetical protein
MQIVYFDPGERPGWDPVSHMARLAGRLLGVEPLVLGPGQGRPGIARKLASAIPRRRGEESCLLICPNPSALWSLLSVEGWRSRFDGVFAWVIDSFWVEWLPWMVRNGGPIDAFFVTNKEELDVWEARTKRPCHWLPWGTDALDLGAPGADRPVDLLRVGRQPAAWNGDDETREACRRAGLAFEGRPPGSDDASDNERMLMRRFATTKFTLSFSNSVNPTNYTHPTREYVTARWVDALASGACVAGVHPRTETVRDLLWPEGLLEIDAVDRDAGIAMLVEAARRWEPRTAQRNHLLALERLDWRWRFEKLASAMGGSFPVLEAELARLRRTIQERGGPAVSPG